MLELESGSARKLLEKFQLEDGSTRKLLENFWLEDGSTRKLLEKFWLETRLGSKILGSKCSSHENFGSVPSLFWVKSSVS